MISQHCWENLQEKPIFESGRPFPARIFPNLTNPLIVCWEFQEEMPSATILEASIQEAIQPPWLASPVSFVVSLISSTTCCENMEYSQKRISTNQHPTGTFTKAGTRHCKVTSAAAVPGLVMLLPSCWLLCLRNRH